MVGQQRNVFAPFGQWRNGQRHHVETVVQILTKLARRHAGLEIAVRSGNQPHVHVNQLRRPDRPHLTLLNHTQQLDLQQQRHVTDFIQKQRTAPGHLKQSLVVAHRAGKRALDVAEQLGFEQLFGNRRAVHRHKWPRLALARIVDGMRQQLLAGTAVALDQHAGIALRHQTGARKQIFHCRALGDDRRAPVGCRCLGLRRAAGGQPERLGNMCQQRFAVERFGQIAKHTALHRCNRIGNAAMRGEDNHRQRRAGTVNLLEQRQPVHPAHAHVGNHQLRPRHVKAVERGFGTVDAIHLVA